MDKAGKKAHNKVKTWLGWVPTDKAEQEAAEQCMEDEKAEKEAEKQVKDAKEYIAWGVRDNANAGRGPAQKESGKGTSVMGFFKCSAPGHLRLQFKMDLRAGPKTPKKA